MFPISNTGVFAAYILATVHLLYLKLGSFSDMEYYFYYLLTGTQKSQTAWLGLIQMQCSQSFDCNWGKQNNPIVCWHQLHPQFWVLQQEKCLPTHQIVWVGSVKLQIAWAARCCLSLKFSLYSHFD